MSYKKKISILFLSLILILTVMTSTVLAEPDIASVEDIEATAVNGSRSTEVVITNEASIIGPMVQLEDILRTGICLTSEGLKFFDDYGTEIPWLSWALQIAEDETHGYSRVNHSGPDYDCSSFVSHAFMSCGILDRDFSSSSIGAGELIPYGFEEVDIEEIEPGDIVWKRGHVELYLGFGETIGAHSAFGHRQTGDQDGREICVVPLSPKFSKAYRYVG